MTNSPNSEEKPNESRLIPFTVAGIVCFGAALLFGIGSWFLFGTNHRLRSEREGVAVQISNQNSGIEKSNTNNSAPSPTPVPVVAPEVVKAPAGEIPVEGGEVMLGGGGDTKLPLRRVAVAPFYIGETEVTNAQYAEFVEDTKHKTPIGWKSGKFPSGGASEPVVGVTWSDANEYCEWLSGKIGATVRLPSEAEWESAARGATGFIYPWGNEWNNEAAESMEVKNGKIHPVKSFPKGRTASGIYDMVGNAYEWTSDLFVDEFGKPVSREKSNQRVIKSGSYDVGRNVLGVKFRFMRPENRASELLGFRYVVVRK